jgi:hypothetical protein
MFARPTFFVVSIVDRLFVEGWQETKAGIVEKQSFGNTLSVRYCDTHTRLCVRILTTQCVGSSLKPIVTDSNPITTSWTPMPRNYDSIESVFL